MNVDAMGKANVQQELTKHPTGKALVGGGGGRGGGTDLRNQHLHEFHSFYPPGVHSCHMTTQRAQNKNKATSGVVNM